MTKLFGRCLMGERQAIFNFGLFLFKVHKSVTNPQNTIFRNSMPGSLVVMKRLGFQPKTVIDVGAGLGTFSLYETFPESRHFLIEPIAENEPYLAQICRNLKNAEYIIAGATKKSGSLNLSVSPDLVSSSISQPSESQSADTYLRTIPAITLDEVCRKRNLEAPYLIKVDVDGQEVDVLAGATQILQQTEYVIVEVTLFGQMYEVMSFMKSQGFVAYDIVEQGYRPSDAVLWQVDMAFVKEFGQFRKESNYLMEQQDITELSSHLKAYRENLIAHIQTYYNKHPPSDSIQPQKQELLLEPPPSQVLNNDEYVII